MAPSAVAGFAIDGGSHCASVAAACVFAVMMRCSAEAVRHGPTSAPALQFALGQSHVKCAARYCGVLLDKAHALALCRFWF